MRSLRSGDADGDERVDLAAVDAGRSAGCACSPASVGTRALDEDARADATALHAREGLEQLLDLALDLLRVAVRDRDVERDLRAVVLDEEQRRRARLLAGDDERACRRAWGRRRRCPSRLRSTPSRRRPAASWSRRRRAEMSSWSPLRLLRERRALGESERGRGDGNASRRGERAYGERRGMRARANAWSNVTDCLRP